MTGSRIALLADAAIDLIAEAGMRGLTHRAVDARARLPLGSTSAYFRTREALIEGVVRRLAELEWADITRDQLASGPPRADPAPLTAADIEHLAIGIATLLDRWLSAHRNRTLARYACLIEATHRPQLRQILSHGTAFRAQAEALLARAGAPDPSRQGAHLVAYIDGLLFDRLAGAGALTAPTPGTTESREDLRQAVQAVLYATTAPHP
ncbi:TetR/AcrR family transcriptional regulator [Micromonospora sp. WMMD1082]|uniref:TetR/AcrR family transcriptional regulator n=1 Tax=Micromonospora sp. WMMD1082 TaxID=3016104 RepID=UPI002415D051|nr:TetR/AcrR family transcriptional regulator [Micromonospora sp. WMMD1082]MDG4797061.1 TetR family transcriptional regulator [Micromonospora sp. WMMD1082]